MASFCVVNRDPHMHQGAVRCLQARNDIWICWHSSYQVMNSGGRPCERGRVFGVLVARESACLPERNATELVFRA